MEDLRYVLVTSKWGLRDGYVFLKVFLEKRKGQDYLLRDYVRAKVDDLV